MTSFYTIILFCFRKLCGKDKCRHKYDIWQIESCFTENETVIIIKLTQSPLINVDHSLNTFVPSSRFPSLPHRSVPLQQRAVHPRDVPLRRLQGLLGRLGRGQLHRHRLPGQQVPLS